MSIVDDLRSKITEILGDPLLFPDDFKNWLISYIETNPPALPSGQVVGLNSSGVPAGVVVEYAGSSAPSGYLICDGSAVSRTTYVDLFNAIGTAYGAGDGSTTFNLPDFRGRMPVGYYGAGQGAVNALGKNEGVAAGNRRPQHRHTPHVHTFRDPGTADGTGAAGGVSGPVSTQNTGSADGGSGVSTDSLDAPAFLIVNFIIKT